MQGQGLSRWGPPNLDFTQSGLFTICLIVKVWPLTHYFLLEWLSSAFLGVSGCFALTLEFFKVANVRIQRPPPIKIRSDDKPCLTRISHFYMFYLSNSHCLVSYLRHFNNINFYYPKLLDFWQTFVLVIMIKQRQHTEKGTWCPIPFSRCSSLE